MELSVILLTLFPGTHSGQASGTHSRKLGRPQSLSTYGSGCCCWVIQLCLTPWDTMDCSTPCFPVLYYPPEFAQTHVYWVNIAIQPSHPLSPPSPPTLNLSQHHSLFQWVCSLHQVAKVLELQRQSFLWIFRVDFLQDWLVWSPCHPRDFQEKCYYQVKNG